MTAISLLADAVAWNPAGTLAGLAALIAAAVFLYMAWPASRPTPPPSVDKPRLTGAAAVRATTVYKVTTLGPRPRPGDPTVILRHRRGGRRAH